MAHRNHPHLPALQFLQDKIPDLSLCNKVQHRRHLVRDQKLRPSPQRSRNTESLKLAAGDLHWEPVFPIVPDPKSRLDPCPLAGILKGPVAFLQNRTQPSLRIHREFRMLPYHLHRAVATKLKNRHPVHKNLPRIRPLVPRQNLAERRLPVSAGRHDPHTLSGFHRKVHMIQDLSRPFSIFKRNISRFQPHLPYSFRMSSKISPISQSCSPSFFQFFGMDRNSAFVYGCLRFLSS